MKKIEYSELQAMGANTIDGTTEYTNAEEMLQDINAMAIEEQREMFEIMVDDFIIDGSGEYDDLIIDWKSYRYDTDVSALCVNAEDETHVYLLVANADNNIELHPIGHK